MANWVSKERKTAHMNCLLLSCWLCYKTCRQCWWRGDNANEPEVSAVNMDAPDPGNISENASGGDWNAGVGWELSIPSSNQSFTIRNTVQDECYGNEDLLSHYVPTNCTWQWRLTEMLLTIRQWGLLAWQPTSKCNNHNSASTFTTAIRIIAEISMASMTAE